MKVSRSLWSKYYGKCDFFNCLLNYVFTKCFENNVKWGVPSFVFDNNSVRNASDFIWHLFCHNNIWDVVWDPSSMAMYQIWLERFLTKSIRLEISHIKIYPSVPQICLPRNCMLILILSYTGMKIFVDFRCPSKIYITLDLRSVCYKIVPDLISTFCIQ
jgi:hypothetical protein